MEEKKQVTFTKQDISGLVVLAVFTLVAYKVGKKVGQGKALIDLKETFEELARA